MERFTLMAGSSPCFKFDNLDGGAEGVVGFVGGGGSWFSDGGVGVSLTVSFWLRTCKGKGFHAVFPAVHCDQLGIGVVGALWDRVSKRGAVGPPCLNG